MDPQPAVSAPASEIKTSGKAIWSLVLGILSNTCLWILGSIPAIILGVKAIKEVDQSEGRIQGRGLAIAGIITGSIGILVGGILVMVMATAAFTMPVASKIQTKAFQSKQMSDMRQIALGCLFYRNDNEGRFPAELAELIPDYLGDEEMLQWRSSEADPAGGQPYQYRPELGDMTQPDEPFLAAPVPLDGKISVAYVDGRVEAIPEEEFREKHAAKFP